MDKLKVPNPRPEAMGRFHFFMMIVWLLLAIPSVLWWKTSILWVIVVSVYANFVGHFSAWDAAKAHKAVEDS